MGDKLTEAFNVYQELQEKYKPSTLLLNGQAVALMCMGKYGESESFLRQALDIVRLFHICVWPSTPIGLVVNSWEIFYVAVVS